MQGAQRMVSSRFAATVLCVVCVFTATRAVADWVLVPEQSAITYLSSKMVAGNFSTLFENNRFKDFSGAINDRGEVLLDIDLNSVDTGIVIRDERVKEHVFDVAKHPYASVKLSVGDAVTRPRPAGQVQAVEAALTMRGVTRQVTGEVSVTQADDVLLVQTTAPILVNAGDYGMLEGFETLKNLVQLFNIPTTIPVSFKLVFLKQ